MGLRVLPGAELDLHGTAFYPTWTRLSATVQRGNNWLALQVRAGQHCVGLAVVLDVATE